MENGMNCMSDEEQRALGALRAVLGSGSTPLAFSLDSDLIPATSRIVVEVEHTRGSNAVLNVELFSHSMSTSASPLIIYVPGICESTETTTVQNLARWAKDIGVRLAVIELEGHGHSSGTPALCPDFDRLVQQVLYATSTITTKLLEERPNTPYIYCGSSMGGTIALYAADYLSTHLKRDKSTIDTQTPASALNYDSFLGSLDFSKGSFSGVSSISPALGVKPDNLPPPFVVSTLKVASFLFPSSQVPFTPYEDSSNYNCPTTTQRNFTGHWPLATSKMLLELTSERIATDIQEGKLTLCDVPRVMIIIGEKDHFIPVDSVTKVFESLQSLKKDMKIMKNAGHDVLSHPEDSPEAIELVFSTLV